MCVCLWNEIDTAKDKLKNQSEMYETKTRNSTLKILDSSDFNGILPWTEEEKNTIRNQFEWSMDALTSQFETMMRARVALVYLSVNVFVLISDWIFVEAIACCYAKMEHETWILTISNVSSTKKTQLEQKKQ